MYARFPVPIAPAGRATVCQLLSLTNPICPAVKAEVAVPPAASTDVATNVLLNA